MNLQNNSLHSEAELGFFHEQEPDIRREPNYVLLLLLIILVLFGIALAAIFLTHGDLPIFE